MKKLTILAMFLMLVSPVYALYSPNESVSFILTLTDYYGNPITDASCNGYIYYPNLTLYTSFPLTYDNSTGVYHHQFVTPADYGTYLEIAKCNFTLFSIPKKISAYKTMYVSKSLDTLEEQIRNISKNISLQVVLNITGNITQAINQSMNFTQEKIDFLTDLMLALHSTPVTKQYCADNKTLIIEKTATWVVGGRTIPIIKNETVMCPYGCDLVRNECISPPYQRYLIVLGIVIFTIAVIIVFWRYFR